jgi:DNA polymerase type B, organellar and viral
MSIKGHWIKPAVSTYGPGCVVSVIVETDTRPAINTRGVSVDLFKRCHVAESHRRSILWSSPEYRSFDSPQGVHDWLESTRSNRRRTYVFTPSAIDTLLLTEMFQRWDVHGCKLTEGTPLGMPSADTVAPPVSPDPSDPPIASVGSDCTDRRYYVNAFIPGINAQIVRYRKNGRGFQWCSHSQYCQSHVDLIAKSIGYKWLERFDGPDGKPLTDHSCMELSHLWLRFYQHLIDWWEDIDGGPWGSTVAAMSYSFLRRRLQPKTILRHNHERTATLENDAIFAGRRSVWYVGNIGTEDAWEHYGDNAPKRSEHGTISGGIVNHDVRSMYPYLLSCMPYPTRLLEFRDSISIAECMEAMETYGCIASVLLRTELPEYPMRRTDGIIYPVGVFRTVLCGPELQRAINREEIIRIDRCALYVMGTPFKESCGELLDMRQAARDGKLDAWGLFIKMLSNSMSGRIAQVPFHWQPQPDLVPLQEWGQWDTRDTATDSIEVYKSYCGMTWKRVQSEMLSRPMGAAYAYLTSYGRWIMSGIRSICPGESVIAQDTDGIWTTGRATRILHPRGITHPCVGGDIHLKTYTPAARFYGPQHYWFGHGWVLSGSNVLAIQPHSDSAIVREVHNLLSTSQRTPDPMLYTRTIERQIGRMHVPGDIDDNGWVQPIRLYADPTI